MGARAAIGRLPAGLDEAVIRDARRRQRRRRFVTGGALALVAALVALLAARLALEPTGGVPGTWRTFSAHGVAVRYPPGWDATATPLTHVTSPMQVLAVASYQLPRSNAGDDGCEPKQAFDRMPPGGAFIFGWGYGDAAALSDPQDFPSRPRRFALRNLGRYECMRTSYMLTFSDAGQAFQIHVALGPRASAATRATVLRILDSFRAQPS